ncbi:hypothetical protein SAMN05444344_2092 [Tenacibaculum mesophilum]|uniref:STAS domain-containing protein n=1 Tax=Tenacibaculum mesophilum TaxID=104268 RepID=A0ABM7CCQ3_9FLAO|nr:STAS domain-containing protein [Tenacibaculum mesophilum]AZJ31496.1 hypothetical protein D6200_02480 [Tenacibaculum mesophilum]QFS29545.1 hypothetical protein F9Y86_14475 [Tenacibaculum mesophilum]SHF94782.1 hypothetical protein SAMN05444344_2092 [Tenacibaculum mesophilum]
MALQISENNGTFYLNGKINNTTVRSFIIHFEYCIEKCKNVVINIDNVNEIGVTGLNAIKTLMAIALKQHKMFSVVGYGCKEVYDHFYSSQVA